MPLSSKVANLVLKRVQAAPDDRLGLLGGDDGVLVAALAKQAARVTLYHTSHSTLHHLRQQLDRVGNVEISSGVFPATDAHFDTMILFAPKGRELARAYLWHAARALRPAGRLFIVGANNAGIKSVIADAQALFASVATLDYKDRQRVALAIAHPSPLPSPEPPEALSLTPQPVEFDTPLGPLVLMTMPGVFSWQSLDDGTRFLLETLDIHRFQPQHTLLDVACGNGVVGLSLARHVGAVMMSDDNLLAVRCARGGVELHSLSHVTVQPGDVYSAVAGQRFDWIIANPPFHRDLNTSMDVARRIISEAPRFLTAGGRLVVVANAFLPYKALFADCFSSVITVAQNNRYVVLEGTK